MERFLCVTHYRALIINGMSLSQEHSLGVEPLKLKALRLGSPLAYSLHNAL